MRLAAVHKMLLIQELFDHDIKIGYCNLYAACSDQLKAVQSTCAQQAGRLVPGLPRRRGGDCHRKLVPDYQAIAATTVLYDKILIFYDF